MLGIGLFVGMASILDLRLLGFIFPRSTLTTVLERIVPLAALGFLVMFVSGILLFYSVPVRNFHSLWFRIKMVLLAAAALNIFLFHRKVKRGPQWAKLQTPPLLVRFMAGFSLLVWMNLIVLGRLIAYDWYDCDKHLNAFLLWVIQCQ